VRSRGEENILHLCARFIDDFAQRERDWLQILNQPFITIRGKRVKQPVSDWPRNFGRHVRAPIETVKSSIQG
jgi:hypothetical protein